MGHAQGPFFQRQERDDVLEAQRSVGFDPHDSRQKRLIGELLWLPAFAQGKLRLVGKWLYDLEATNRRKVDYGQVTIGDTF